MNTRSISPVLGIALLTMAMTVGCTATPVPDPPVSDPAVTDPAPPGDVEADDCVVGTWNLDVDAYAADSESYLGSIGIPVEAFLMTGVGKLTITDDGLVATEISLDTTAAVGGVAVSAPSKYTATGDWSRTGDDSLQFDNWARVGDEPDIPPEVELPTLDVTQLADVAVECSAGSLFLQGSGAPFGASWTR